MPTSVALELTQSLLTNGARAAATYFLQTCYLLAIPQLALDIPNGTVGMEAGNSNTPLILYRTSEGSSQFQEIQQLDAPGGEDAEFFHIDDRTFLATATIRTGSDPTYEIYVESCIFEWNGETMTKFQCIPTFGAKQWRAFDQDGRHFLALAQDLGVTAGEDPAIPSTNSTIYEWDGERFQPFQTVPSTMGYNWLYFSIGDNDFLAYADNLELSYVLQWDGEKFAHFQTLDGIGGRAFSFFERNDRTYLAFARITDDSLVYTWNGESFEFYQALTGAGGREFALVEDASSLYLVHVKFITGTVDDPTTALTSVIYRVAEDGFEIATEFPTFGATDVSTLSINGATYLLITESLTEDVHFRQDSYLYKFVTNATSQPAAEDQDAVSKRSRALATRSQPPEFLNLFAVYTSGNSSIGYKYRSASAETLNANAMIVATSSNLILYPGNGQDPSYINFRLANGGFMELASISHLGPAVASIAQLRLLHPDSDEWRTSANQLRNATLAVQAVNSEALWTDTIAVPALSGREAGIAAMVDYACQLTTRFLDAVLADPSKLTAEYVRNSFMEASSSGDLHATIPYNAVMIATFFLVGITTAISIQEWLTQYDIDWANAMVMVAGQQGRETAGVTISSNSVAQVFLKSFPDLPIGRLYIAPHAPAPTIVNGTTEELLQYEEEYRVLYGGLHGIAGLGEQMFQGYPAYKVAEDTLPTITNSTTSVSELPLISSPDDWLALTTRLRVVLEDVRQLLSGAVTDYAAQQLFDHGFAPANVTVPGLDGYDYAAAAAKLS